MSEFQEIEATVGPAYEIVHGRLRSLGRISTEFLTQNNTVGLLELAQMLVAVEIATDDLDYVPQPELEYSQTQPDGSLAHIRLWQDRYEINGTIKKNNNDVSFADEKAILQILLDNAGRPIPIRKTALNADFLERLAPVSRVSTFNQVLSSFQQKAKGTRLFSRGSIGSGPNVRGWFGLDVDSENFDSEKFKRAMVGDVIMTYQPIDNDAEAKPVIIYEDGYEISGLLHETFSASSRRIKYILQLMLTSPGKKFTLENLLSEVSYTEDGSAVGQEALRLNMRSLVEQSGTSGIIQTGTLNGKTKWWGVVEESTSLPLAELQNCNGLVEYLTTSADGKHAYIRLWEDGFDMNGFIVTDAARWAVGRDRYATIKLLVENAGRPLTMDDVLNSPNFLPELKTSSKRLYFHTAFSALNSMDEAAGLLQTGLIPGQKLKKWYGVGVDDAAVEELGQRMQTNKQQNEKGKRALDEIVNPEQDDILFPEQDSAPEDSAKIVRTAWMPTPNKKTLEDSLNLQQLFSLAKAKPQYSEVLRYIANRGETELRLVDLATEATSLEIPVRQYETKIIPALNSTARQLGINIKFVLKKNFRKDGTGGPFLTVQIFS